MSVTFVYPSGTVNKDNYALGGGGILVPQSGGAYDNFYWLDANAVTLVEDVTDEVTEVVSVDGTIETEVPFSGTLIGVAVVDFRIRIKDPTNTNKNNNVVIKVNGEVRTDYSITGNNQITFDSLLLGDPDIVEATVSTNVTTYSKQGMQRESVVILGTIGINYILQLPVGFDVTEAEQWMTGGGENPFVPSRWYDKAGDFPVGFGGSIASPEDVRNSWRAQVLQLLNQRYP